MKHSRSDYNRIQDSDKLIPDDEPVFLLRASDKFAPATMDYWIGMLIRESGDSKTIARLQDHAQNMRVWQNEHGGGKVPDAPEDNNIDRDRFFCGVCSGVFDSQELLDKHMKVDHYVQ